MLKNASTSLIVRGVLALIVGVIAIAWPNVTILALVILFAIYAFLDAGLEFARAFSSGRAGPVIGHLLLGLLGLAAGVVALVWPSPTALVLTLVVGVWAVMGGPARNLRRVRPWRDRGHPRHVHRDRPDLGRVSASFCSPTRTPAL
jgi:uncharacterized membrane protein HdeD (DUF308 family)